MKVGEDILEMLDVKAAFHGAGGVRRWVVVVDIVER